jgi:hypothetical protein
LFPEPPSMDHVKKEVIAAFREVFGYEIKKTGFVLFEREACSR